MYSVELEEFEDGEDDVIDIAETEGLPLLGVVEPVGPVDSDVGVLTVDLNGGANAAPTDAWQKGRARRRRGSPRPC
jgi:hypothetical protein